VNKIYIETSVLNRAIDDFVSAESLREKLSLLGFEPATGLITINELARTFLNTRNVLRATSLFATLRELNPAYQPEIPWLLAAEIDKLRHGVAVLPFLDSLNLAATRAEVMRLANGNFDDGANRFIDDTLKRKRHNREQQQSFVSHVDSLREAIPGIRKLRTFNDVWSHIEAKGDTPHLVRAVLRGAVTTREADELAMRLTAFPTIAAAIRANVYLNFVMVAHTTIPGKDKLDDYKHLIAAAYCSAFLTADKQVAAIQCIVPHLQAYSWNDIIASIGSDRAAAV